MTKKNLRPQQSAPVQRETTVKTSVGEKGLGASNTGTKPRILSYYPVARKPDAIELTGHPLW